MLHTASLIVAGLALVGILSAELEALGIRNPAGRGTGHAFELFPLFRPQSQGRFRSSHCHRHPPFCTGDAYIPGNTIATYLWDRT
jgi:hypothetical protein